MKAFRVLESILAIGVVGLLWALGCVGVVTVGPSTAAMFGVFSEWEPGQGPPSIWTTFWSRFRGHFRQSLGIGLGLMAVIGVLYLDAWYGLSAEDAPIRPVVLAAAIFGGVLVTGTMVFLFPVLVSYPAGWRRVLRNSALFAAGYVWTTLQGIFVWAVAVLAVFWSPVLLPFAIALAAFAVTRLTGRAFERYSLHQISSDLEPDETGESHETGEPSRNREGDSEQKPDNSEEFGDSAGGPPHEGRNTDS